MIYSLVKVHKPQHNYWAISTIYNYLKDMEEEASLVYFLLTGYIAMYSPSRGLFSI